MYGKNSVIIATNNISTPWIAILPLSFLYAISNRIIDVAKYIILKIFKSITLTAFVLSTLPRNKKRKYKKNCH